MYGCVCVCVCVCVGTCICYVLVVCVIDASCTFCFPKYIYCNLPRTPHTTRHGYRPDPEDPDVSPLYASVHPTDNILCYASTMTSFLF